MTDATWARPAAGKPLRLAATAGAVLLASVACAADARAPFYADSFSTRPTAEAMTELGRRLFSDPSLSASGKISCATCHDPEHAYGPANDRPVQPGGADLRATGLRAVPSLRYLQNVPSFTEHFAEDEQGGIDQGPAGGHTWDGRADTVHDQARLPLLSPAEMANADPDAIVAHLEHGENAARFRDTFGTDVFADRAKAFKGLLLALEVFQQSPADFYPYTSRYDAWLRGKGTLDAREQRGLALFDDPKKGNCASCHPSGKRQGALPTFTDFGFAALGVPRNAAIPANRNSRFHDLGLCGPERKDLTDRREYCGLFRVPTLRNVALRRTFFHNGAFHDLARVLRFYVERDLRPREWYERGRDGKTRAFDDLPAEYQNNVNHEPPFDRAAGEAPALSAGEIRDVIAFLGTLTDADLTPPHAERNRRRSRAVENERRTPRPRRRPSDLS